MQQQQQQAATTFCPVCAIHLSYPAGSSLIQCPSCSHTIDPNVPQQTRCVRCKTLLAYPPNSLFIQCPKCNETMDPRSTAMGNMGGAANQPILNQTAKQSKKRRDPNAPKAVSNAYMIFCKSRRSELKQENPDLPFGKIGARLGEIWRTMTPEQKKPYEDKASQDRERYRKEMLDYQIDKHHPESNSNKKQKTEGGSDHSDFDHDDYHSEHDDDAKPEKTQSNDATETPGSE